MQSMQQQKRSRESLPPPRWGRRYADGHTHVTGRPSGSRSRPSNLVQAVPTKGCRLDAHADRSTSGPAAVGRQITDGWWGRIGDIRRQIDELEFIRGLGDGSLPREAFLWYLRQDALYLHDYARILAAAGEVSPTPAEQEFWTHGAQSSVAMELELHKSWIPADAMAHLAPSPVTQAYLDQLADVAAGRDYGQIVAAVLPCYWIYADVGARLARLNRPGHRYGSWLDTYSDEEFAEQTRQAIGFAGAAAARSTEPGRHRMWQAFNEASWHELRFFAAPLELGVREG